MKMLFKKGDVVKITDEFREYFLKRISQCDRPDDIEWLFCEHKILKCEKASFNDVQIYIKTNYVVKYRDRGFYVNYNFQDDASKLMLFKKV